MDSVGALLLFSRTKDVNIHKLRTLRRHVVAIELKQGFSDEKVVFVTFLR